LADDLPAETSRKSGALTYLEPLGPPRPVAGHLYLFTCVYITSEFFFQHTMGGNCKICYAVRMHGNFVQKRSISSCFVILSQICHLLTWALSELSTRPTCACTCIALVRNLLIMTTYSHAIRPTVGAIQNS